MPRNKPLADQFRFPQHTTTFIPSAGQKQNNMLTHVLPIILSLSLSLSHTHTHTQTNECESYW